MEPVKALGWVELLLMLVPVAAAIAVSLAWRIGQWRRITIATVRSIVQLAGAGLIIGWIFQRDTWYWVVILLIVMTVIAAVTAAGQVGRRSPGLIAAMSVVLGAVTAVALLYYTTVVIGLERWEARYLIPLGGMLLGNAMTAVTLAVERLHSELRQRVADVETYLSLGASPWQAVQPAMRAAVAAGLTPTINAMLIVGVVKLPGMMTGQMLGGSSPWQAAMYQLLILTAIVFTDLLAATAAAVWLYRRWFTPAWQVRIW